MLRPTDAGSVRVGGATERPLAADRLLTVGEVAATMRVSKMTVYRLIRSGQLSAIQVGKSYRIYESAVATYLAERAVRVEER